MLPDDQPYLRAVPREEERALSRRVPAPDDGDGIAAAQLRLDRRGRVVDARLLELLEPGHPQLAIPGPGGYQERSALEALPVVHGEEVVAAAPFQLRRRGGHAD